MNTTLSSFYFLCFEKRNFCGNSQLRVIRIRTGINAAWNSIMSFIDPSGFFVPFLPLFFGTTPEKPSVISIRRRMIRRCAAHELAYGQVTYRFPGCHRDHCLLELGRDSRPHPLDRCCLHLRFSATRTSTDTRTLILVRVAAPRIKGEPSAKLF